MDDLRQQLEQAMSQFTRQQASLIEAKNELAALSVTLRSKDRAVEVTVGPQGEPTALRFLNNKHQSMSAQALAASVLEVMTAAREQVARTAADRLAQFTGAGAGVAGTNLDGIDLDRLLEPLTGDSMLSWLRPGGEDPATPSADAQEGKKRA